MSSAGQDRAGVASGINNAVSRAGGLLSIAFAGLVAYERFGSSLFRRLDELGVSAPVRELLTRQRGKLAATTIPSSLPPHLQRALQQVVDQSFVDAFHTIMLLAAGLCLGAAGVAWLMIESVRSHGLGPRVVPVGGPPAADRTRPLHE
jgi:hypothetical protein